MSHVYVNATVRGKRSKRARFLVDTGATHSLVSPKLAREAGLVVGPARDKVRLANGKTLRIPLASGVIKVDGREAGVAIWVGPCDEPLIGVETLESLGLCVDPRSGRLKPTRPYAGRLGGLLTR